MVKLMTGHKPVKLAYEVHRPKSGENKTLNPIIYVHGLAGSKELWHNIPQRISNATKRLSYTYDERDHGDTEWTGEYDFEIAIDDLKDFMESHLIKKAILIGHSSGGYTVSMFGLKYPELVEMIIIEDMTLKPEVIMTIAPFVLHYIKLWQESVKTAPSQLNEAEAVIHALNELYSRIPEKTGMEEKEYLYKYQYPIKRTRNGYDVKHNMNILIEHLKNPKGRDLKEIDGVFTGPAYFMMASESGFQEGLVDEKFKRQFPNAEVEVIEGATHNIHLRHPDMFVEKFLKFHKKHFKTPVEKSRL